MMSIYLHIIKSNPHKTQCNVTISNVTKYPMQGKDKHTYVTTTHKYHNKHNTKQNTKRKEKNTNQLTARKHQSLVV